MKMKRILRLIVLALFIAMACILPVPITHYNKDKSPKYLVEQIDKNEDDADEEDIKELF